MSILALTLLIAGLAGIIGEILVKDPATLFEVAGTREFALARPERRAATRGETRPSNRNEPLPAGRRAA